MENSEHGLDKIDTRRSSDIVFAHCVVDLKSNPVCRRSSGQKTSEFLHGGEIVIRDACRFGLPTAAVKLKILPGAPGA